MVQVESELQVSHEIKQRESEEKARQQQKHFEEREKELEEEIHKLRSELEKVGIYTYTCSVSILCCHSYSPLAHLTFTGRYIQIVR